MGSRPLRLRRLPRLRADLGEHLWPLAAFLALLSAAALWLERADRFAGDPEILRPSFLGTGAAAGSLAVVLVWTLRTDWRPLPEGRSWELAGVCLGLAVLFHLAGEWDLRRRGDAQDPPPGDGSHGAR